MSSESSSARASEGAGGVCYEGAVIIFELDEDAETWAALEARVAAFLAANPDRELYVEAMGNDRIRVQALDQQALGT